MGGGCIPFAESALQGRLCFRWLVFGGACPAGGGFPLWWTRPTEGVGQLQPCPWCWVCADLSTEGLDGLRAGGGLDAHAHRGCLLT